MSSLLAFRILTIKADQCPRPPVLKHIDRIDVDDPLNLVAGLQIDQGMADGRTERPGCGGLQLDLISEPAAEFSDRRRCRAEQASVGLVFSAGITQPIGHVLGEIAGGLRARAPDYDSDHASKRGVPVLSADRYFGRDEAAIVVPDGCLDRGTIGVEGLHEHPPTLGPTTGSAGHLSDQLKGPLSGAKVGQMECRIGIDDPDERDFGEIESLGDHLGAKQDAYVTTPERVERPRVAPSTPHAVGVHTQARSLGEPGTNLGFEPLRAHSTVADTGHFALGACLGGRRPVVAIVAHDDVFCAMVRQRDVALRAPHTWPHD